MMGYLGYLNYISFQLYFADWLYEAVYLQTPRSAITCGSWSHCEAPVTRS